jgi:hypothetical protein
MLFDRLQKHLEKFVNGPGLVHPVYEFLKWNRHESFAP